MNDLDPLSPNSADSQRRLLVALALAMVLTYAFTTFFAPKGPAPEAGAADAGAQVVGLTDAGTPGLSPPPAPGTPPSPGTPEGAVAEAPAPPVRVLDLKRTQTLYSFSTEGAGLNAAVLQGTKMREQQHLSVVEGYKLLFGGEVPPPPQMNLAQPVPGQPLPLAVSIEGPSPLLANARYALDETVDAQRGATFTARQGPWEVVKSVQWPQEGFELIYTVQVKNTSAQPLTGELKVHYNRAIDPENEHAPSFFGGVGNLSYASCHVGEEKHKISVDEKQPEPETLRGPVHYFGIDQQYFLSALYPLEGPLQGRCELVSTAQARAVAAVFPLTAAPGQTVTLRFGGYFGPKDPDLLAALPGPELRASASLPASAYYVPPLAETIDYGLWAVIAKLLVAVMKFFHNLVGNWGVAIILLTVLVKTLLLPLTHKSMVSMESMKKLQPRIEELRKKHGDDRERQNMEMMKLYQEAKVNPIGGCLPMLIQMPVWIALFTALRNSYDIYQEPFFGPVWRDLTYKDPTYLLPVAQAVSMIITQKLQPQMGDPAQARLMTWFVPIIFTLTLLNYPAGLALYIFTNNILSIAQQYGLRKWLARKEAAVPATPPAATGGKRK